MDVKPNSLVLKSLSFLAKISPWIWRIRVFGENTAVRSF